MSARLLQFALFALLLVVHNIAHESENNVRKIVTTVPSERNAREVTAASHVLRKFMDRLSTRVMRKQISRAVRSSEFKIKSLVDKGVDGLIQSLDKSELNRLHIASIQVPILDDSIYSLTNEHHLPLLLKTVKDTAGETFAEAGAQVANRMDILLSSLEKELENASFDEESSDVEDAYNMMETKHEPSLETPSKKRKSIHDMPFVSATDLNMTSIAKRHHKRNALRKLNIMRHVRAYINNVSIPILQEVEQSVIAASITDVFDGFFANFSKMVKIPLMRTIDERLRVHTILTQTHSSYRDIIGFQNEFIRSVSEDVHRRLQCAKARMTRKAMKMIKTNLERQMTILFIKFYESGEADVPPYMSVGLSFTPRGLKNPDNRCYMNSLLQLLLYCELFHQYFFIYHHYRSDAGTQNHKEMRVHESIHRFIWEFEHDSSTRKSGAFSAQYVLEALDAPKGEQEDAEEYLRKLLDGLNDEILVNTPRAAVMLPPDLSWEEFKTASFEEMAGSIFGYSSTPSTPITQIFGLQIENTLHLQNQTESHSVEHFLILPVPIVGDGIVNLFTAIQAALSPEVVQLNDDLVTKSYSIERLPSVLLLHLKRFTYTIKALKLMKHIPIDQILYLPVEMLSENAKRDLVKRKAVTATSNAVQYRLRGVVYHHGKFPTNGHYTADVCHKASGKWLRIDDEHIKEISENSVARRRVNHKSHKTAYILMYELITD